MGELVFWDRAMVSWWKLVRMIHRIPLDDDQYWLFFFPYKLIHPNIYVSYHCQLEITNMSQHNNNLIQTFAIYCMNEYNISPNQIKATLSENRIFSINDCIVVIAISSSVAKTAYFNLKFSEILCVCSFYDYWYCITYTVLLRCNSIPVHKRTKLSNAT